MALVLSFPYKKALKPMAERSSLMIMKTFLSKSAMIFGLAVVPLAPLTHAEGLTIAAAASLQDALKEMKAELEQEVGMKINVTTGASGTLQQQITQGAPIDIFLSAADRPIQELEKLKLLAPNTTKVFLSNELVLIAPLTSPLKSTADLKAATVKHIALGEPRSVPAGDYAMQSLTSLKLDQELIPKFLYGKDVRQVLAYVERGEVEAGFVYKSDLQSESGKKVLLIQELPAESHKAIRYTMTVVAASKSQDKAKKVLSHFEGPKAALIWSKYGFSTMGDKSASHLNDKGNVSAPQ